MMSSVRNWLHAEPLRLEMCSFSQSVGKMNFMITYSNTPWMGTSTSFLYESRSLVWTHDHGSDPTQLGYTWERWSRKLCGQAVAEEKGLRHTKGLFVWIILHDHKEEEDMSLSSLSCKEELVSCIFICTIINSKQKITHKWKEGLPVDLWHILLVIALALSLSRKLHF